MDTIKAYMKNMDCLALLLFCGANAAVVICGILVITKLRTLSGTTKSNKVSPSSSFKPLNCTDDTADISSVGSNKKCRNISSTSGKQYKPRNGNKRQDSKNNITISRTKNNHDHMILSRSTVKNWLQSDAFCYDRRIISSCFEDNMTSCHDIQQRNDIITETGGFENLNSYSMSQAGQSKQGTILRQKRQQKRKQHSKNSNNTNVKIVDVDVDVDEQGKKYAMPSRTKKTVLNLRKQCTKAAALRTVLNNSKISKGFNHGHSNLESSLSFNRSSLSAASSTTSINSSISSSASNSPTHSLHSSPTASPTASKRNTEYVKKLSLVSPLRQFTKLNMNEQELVKQMSHYVIDPSLLRIYGFPVDSVHHRGCVEIYKCLPKHLAEEAVTKDNQRHHRHFYGRKKSDVINDCDSLHCSSWGQHLYACRPIDSGHGSGDSSPRFTDSDSSELGEDDSIVPIMAFYTPDGVYQIFSDYCNSLEKQCVRCCKMFKVNEKGEYLSFDSCTYHWGKLSNVYDGKSYINIYSCCQGEELSEGCSKHSLHVWNGIVVGINGPYAGFLHTQHKKANRHKHRKLYAIDCEMSYTGLGLEVTKVTVVSFDGSLVYEHFVQPQAEIIDYNTRFSGVSEEDFSPVWNTRIKTFEEVQKDLLNLFDADTILVGHGLDNDLKVLRLVHNTVVDTSVVFSHSTGYPYRRSLKNLTKSFLKRDIQCGDMGHSSLEDSRACLELMMWKIRKDLRHWNYQ